MLLYVKLWLATLNHTPRSQHLSSSIHQSNPSHLPADSDLHWGCLERHVGLPWHGCCAHPSLLRVGLGRNYGCQAWLGFAARMLCLLAHKIRTYRTWMWLVVQLGIRERRRYSECQNERSESGYKRPVAAASPAPVLPLYSRTQVRSWLEPGTCNADFLFLGRPQLPEVLLLHAAGYPKRVAWKVGLLFSKEAANGPACNAAVGLALGKCVPR